MSSDKSRANNVKEIESDDESIEIQCTPEIQIDPLFDTILIKRQSALLLLSHYKKDLTKYKKEVKQTRAELAAWTAVLKIVYDEEV